MFHVKSQLPPGDAMNDYEESDDDTEQSEKEPLQCSSISYRISSETDLSVKMVPTVGEKPVPIPNENLPDISIERKALTVRERQRQFVYEPPVKKGICEKVTSSAAKSLSCSSQRMQKCLLSRLPILRWLPKYQLKQDLMGDVIAGITIAVMHIPQGMAYAMLAGLAPIHGIYMAFFPVLVYTIFGTSKHCSLGTFAVVCIMVGKVVSEHAIPENPDEKAEYIANALADNITVYTNVEVATIVSFSVGVWLLLFAVLQLGTLSVFMSDMLVSGFTTGAGVHVLTSQVKHLFGLQIPRHSGPLKIIHTYENIIAIILSSNKVTVILSVVCLTLLILNNEVLKPFLQKRTRIPFPIELMLVIFGTVTSYYGHLNADYNVNVVGHIPTGLPSPRLPRFELFSAVMVDSLIIAIVSYTISFAMAKILAKKNYVVNPTQELVAQSFADLVGSMFACAPVSVSLSRSLIQVSVGGATQVTSVISCSLLLMVLLFLGPFFETLPNCVLASIILVALKGMFLQFKDFFKMLKISYLDSFLWISTFIAVVVIDIDYGLCVGILVSCVILILRNQTPSIRVLGKVPNSDIYLNIDRYAMANEVPEFKICEISGNLHFANQVTLKKELIRKTGLDLRKIMKRLRTENATSKAIEANQHSQWNGNMTHARSTYLQDVFENGKVINDTYLDMTGDTKPRKHRPSITKVTPDKTAIISQPIKRVSVNKTISLNLPISTSVKYLILDCSGVGVIDASAAKNIAALYKEFADAQITMVFSGLSEDVIQVMETCECLKEIPENLLFHSIHDAISVLSQDQLETERL